MTFRCPHCHTAVWIQPVHCEKRKTSVDCQQCGQTYVLKAWNKLRKASRALSVFTEALDDRDQIAVSGGELEVLAFGSVPHALLEAWCQLPVATG